MKWEILDTQVRLSVDNQPGPITPDNPLEKLGLPAVGKPGWFVAEDY